ncbi:helix-turn-helix transcriptional regulator [Halomicrobium salinisoli]|uniref:helix-turn-helix transcriptional regulator n=1 Tax=Halomicrobium salinisoli TaxID=2878391 RepID=UPI001CF05ACF|nr:hypothetical protein [Halomicrobium salinisoli]
MEIDRGRTVVAFVVLVSAVALTVPSGAATETETGDPDLTADDIIVSIDVRENGTAFWSIEYHYRLDTPAKQSGFDRLRDRVDANRDEHVSRVRDDVGGTVGIAENRTGRSMGLSGVTVRTRRQAIPREVGIVVHEFAWRGFAAVNDTHVRIGDAIAGFYVGPRTMLKINWPSEYAPARVEPPADERGTDEASWSGGEFGADEPRIVLERESDGPPLWQVSAAGMLLLLLSATTVAYVRGDDDRRRGDESVAEAADASGGDSEEGGAGPGADRSPELDRETDESGREHPPEPLSDAERVRWVLESHGGRVKQQTIAEECGWGDSKTSKVVSDLHERGEVDRFRLGRENVVSLPEVRYDEDRNGGGDRA